MSRVPQQLLRLATVLIAMSVSSAAIAVATVDVTYTGPKSKIEETTIRLLDSTGNPVQLKSVGDERTRFTVDSGSYRVGVYVGGKEVSRSEVNLAEGNNTLRVNAETGTVQIVQAPQPSGVKTPSITVSGGGNRIRDKPPTTGVNESGTTPAPLLKGPTSINNYSVDVNFLSPEKEVSGGTFADFQAYQLGIGAWFNASPSTSAQVPEGMRTGWAYWMPASNGSTGITSLGGADAQFKTRFNGVHVNGSLLHRIKEEAPWSVFGRPTLGFEHSEFKYEASIVNSSVPGVSSTTDQQATEDNLSLGYRLLAVYRFSNGAWAGAGAGLEAIFYHFHYNGTQDNMCAVCTPPTDHFTVSMSDSMSGVTWGASANAIVGFPIAQNAEIFLMGTYAYHDKSAVVTSKVVPTDDAPHLRTASRDVAGGQFGLLIRF